MAKQKLYNLPKDAENAFQIWSVLVWAAKHRQTLTYKDLSGPTGIYWQNFDAPLGVIKNYCDENLPGCHLTVLVVEKATGKPGSGLDTVQDDDFDKAREAVFDKVWESKPGGKDWEELLNNPGLTAFHECAKKWNDRQSSAS